MSSTPKAVCFVCDAVIPTERVRALVMLGKPPESWTHVQCSVETYKKGIYLGEHGTSHMLLVDKVYDDSVREIFGSGED